jgi:hypothetical protein
VLQGGVGIEWHLRDSDSARPSRQASNRNYNGQTGAVQGYEAAREAALGSVRKKSWRASNAQANKRPPNEGRTRFWFRRRLRTVQPPNRVEAVDFFL